MGGSGTHVIIIITSRYIFASESPLLSLWYFSLRTKPIFALNAYAQINKCYSQQTYQREIHFVQDHTLPLNAFPCGISLISHIHASLHDTRMLLWLCNSFGITPNLVQEISSWFQTTLARLCQPLSLSNRPKSSYPQSKLFRVSGIKTCQILQKTPGDCSNIVADSVAL